MASSTSPLDHVSLEEKLYRILGHFFVAFARMELNLSLRVGGEGTFKEKLERMLLLADEASNEETSCKILASYKAANDMRNIRNRLAHGRWGYLTHLQQVVHVAGYPPGPQDERRNGSQCRSRPQLDKHLRCHWKVSVPNRTIGRWSQQSGLYL